MRPSGAPRLLRSVCILAAACTACGEAADRAATFTVVDSAGIRIVESEGPEWTDGNGWRMQREPVLQIGARDGPPDLLLDRVSGAVRLSDGRIAIADAGVGQIRIHGTDGRLERTIGRAGGGPGEYRNLSSLQRTAGDTLLAFDARAGRIDRITADGVSVEEHILTPRSAVAAIMTLTDGSHVAMAVPAPQPPGRDALVRPAAPVLRFDANGAFIDTLAILPGPVTHVFQWPDGRIAVGLLPLGPLPVVAVDGDHVLLGTGDDCSVRRLGADGAVIAIHRWQPCDRDVPEEAIEAYRADAMAQAEPLGEPWISRARELLDATPFPEQRAAYGRVLTSKAGEIWIAESVIPGADASRWAVLHPDGHLLGFVDVPPRFRLLDAGDDYVLGRWRDEADVEYVRMHRLVR